jgi:hypothetical protein
MTMLNLPTCEDELHVCRNNGFSLLVNGSGAQDSGDLDLMRPS